MLGCKGRQAFWLISNRIAATAPLLVGMSSVAARSTFSDLLHLPQLGDHSRSLSSWLTPTWPLAKEDDPVESSPSLSAEKSEAEGGGNKPAAEEKPVRRKKLTKKQRFGKYDEEFDDEMAQIPIDESIEHLYDARPIFEDWMGHPTFYDMISADAYPKKGAPQDKPPGEGPILRWETRVVLSPGGEAFHPKNRKVKVSVYVKELELTPAQRERLLFMVGKRYNPNKDELTIISERFDQREENRKDVLRTLLALIEEAKKEDEVYEGAQEA